MNWARSFDKLILSHAHVLIYGRTEAETQGALCYLLIAYCGMPYPDARDYIFTVRHNGGEGTSHGCPLAGYYSDFLQSQADAFKRVPCFPRSVMAEEPTCMSASGLHWWLTGPDTDEPLFEPEEWEEFLEDLEFHF